VEELEDFEVGGEELNQFWKKRGKKVGSAMCLIRTWAGLVAAEFVGRRTRLRGILMTVSRRLVGPEVGFTGSAVGS
jgi:hypothetical protein